MSFCFYRYTANIDPKYWIAYEKKKKKMKKFMSYLETQQNNIEGSILSIKRLFRLNTFSHG